MPASSHHTQKLRTAQLWEYDAQACLAAALGVTGPQPHSPISYTDVNESFAESFGVKEINTDEGDKAPTDMSQFCYQGYKTQNRP